MTVVNCSLPEPMRYVNDGVRENLGSKDAARLPLSPEEVEHILFLLKLIIYRENEEIH